MHPMEEAWRKARKGLIGTVINVDDQRKASLSPEFEAWVKQGRWEAREAGNLDFDPHDWLFGEQHESEGLGERAIGYALGSLIKEETISRDNWDLAENRPFLFGAIEIFSLWRKTKRIYQIERALQVSLGKLKGLNNLPVKSFRLPLDGILLDLLEERDMGRGAFRYLWVSYGFDDSDTRKRAGMHMQFRGLKFEDGHLYFWQNLADVDTACESIDDYFEKLGKLYKSRRAKGTEDLVRLKADRPVCDKVFQVAVPVLLYVNGNEDIVREIHPGAKPRKTSANPEKEKRFRDLDEPTVYTVGKNFVSTLEHWEKRNPVEPQGGTHASPCPHFRSPHAHLFWTGKGREEPRIHFLPMIKVKGGTKGEPEQPHVTIVK